MTACRAFLVLPGMLLIASIAGAQPIARVVVRPSGRHLVGQPVQIDVQVLVPNFFLSAPKFPTLEIPGAVVTMPDESGVNLNDTIGGVGYAGIQKTYVFVAQTAGPYSLPPAVITFRYAIEPGRPAEGSVKLPPTVIATEWPAGMKPPPDGASAVVARVTIDQKLDRDPASLRAGDALTRTIVTTAAATQAMFIPPPAFTAPDGVRVYRKDPVLTDEHKDRVGLVAGHRTDQVVYTFDAPGSYDLPAYEVTWFNRQRNREEIARAATVHVTATAGSPTADAIAPEPPPLPVSDTPDRGWKRTLFAASVVVVGLAIAWASRRRSIRVATRLLAWLAIGWAAVRRDRAKHLPPLNPV